MKAMIMAAGVGSRLTPLTMGVPKPMVPMANRPLMESIVMNLAEAGVTDIVANLHHHEGQIGERFGDGSAYGVRLEYSLEKELMGTAGGVKRCQPFLDETFVVMSGDVLTDVDIGRLVAEHKRRGALATIALKPVAAVEQYGVVVTDEEDRIRAFQEKPKKSEALSNLVNTGIYIFEPEIFSYIPENTFYDFGKQVFPHLVKEGAPFYGITVDSYWCDVGTLETYLNAHFAVLERECRFTPCGTLIERHGDGSRILLGQGTVLGGRSMLLGRVAIGERCAVEDRCVVKDSVIWADTVLEAGCVLDRAIVADHCVIGPGAVLEPGSVVGSGCVIEPGTRVPAGARVFRQGDTQVMAG